MRQRIANGDDRAAICSNDCIQNMYKTVANSLYGYMNYDRGILYSPSAAITLFSRKIFAETTYLYERRAATATGVSTSNDDAPWVVVYRDTDGLVVATHRRLSREEETRVLSYMNGQLAESIADASPAITSARRTTFDSIPSILVLVSSPWARRSIGESRRTVRSPLADSRKMPHRSSRT